MSEPDRRDQLLLKMYDQMFSDINRHILVVWQSVGVLVGAFAIFALTEKRIITIDVATALVVLLAAWLVAHLYDAAYWYNRNLTIIANIERQFLVKDDLKLVHYYFGKHRPNNPMLTHLKIQYALAVGLVAIVLGWHFLAQVVPGFGAPWATFDPLRAVPYATTIAAVGYLARLRRQRNKSYTEFVTNSPGMNVDVAGIQYGVGHGFPDVPLAKPPS